MSLILQDSIFCGEGEKLDYYSHSASYMRAVDQLNTQFADGKLQIVSLLQYAPQREPECPVWYEVIDYHYVNNKYQVNEVRFLTSHYIGRYAYDGYEIVIEPRFGKVFNYMVGYATNMYLPVGDASTEWGRNNSYWLIALLWKAMLSRALTQGQIPKQYQTITRNLRHYRGHLDVSKHIHANLCNASRFYCSYKKLSMDNTINRAIRHTYALLKQKGVTPIVSEFEAYDMYLASMGVQPRLDNLSELDSIRYTKLNIAYRPVINLSRTILSNMQAEATSGGQQGVSYFIDIADLWEMYLIKLLQNHLPSEYRVYSPNAQGGEMLLGDQMREIRPDILIERDGRIMMIIDAKYKRYDRFGRTATNGISREDLYQMSTYLYHYGGQDQPIVGVFTSPIPNAQNEDVHPLSHNDGHRIGLVNMDIKSPGDDLDAVHDQERLYINKIKRLLGA